MTFTHPDDAAFLSAILAHPEDDLPRLVWADKLDETAGDGAPCPTCRGKGERSVYERGEYGPNHYLETCPTCRGSGTVSDGRSARAEFIRVQVRIGEIWKPPFKPTPDDREELERLVVRERELFPLVVPGKWTFPHGGPTLRFPDGTERVYHRGFCETLRAPLAAFWGERECSGCGGTGERAFDPADPLPFHGDEGRCPHCSGNGRVPGPTPAFTRLCQTEPVTECIPSDKEPSEVWDGKFAWFGVPDPATPDDLPRELWDALEGAVRVVDDSVLASKVYDTPAAARAALGAALLRVGGRFS